MVYRFILLLVAMFGLVACVNTYSYNGITYNNVEHALAALHVDLNRKLTGVDVVQEADRVGGVAVLLVPNEEFIRRRGINRFGSGKVSENIIQYFVDVQMAAYKSIGKAVEKSDLFDKVIVRTTVDGDIQGVKNADYLIWTIPEHGNIWEWYAKSKNGPKRRISWQVSLPPHEVYNDLLTKLRKKLVAQPAGHPVLNKEKEEAELVIVSTGTGFWTSGHGYGITNHHVVEGCTRLQGKTPFGTIPLQVISTDPNLDIALTKADFRPAQYAKFSEDFTVRLAEEVVVFGFPFQDILSTQGNATTGVVSALSGVNNDTTRLQITAPVQPGNSGGPVLDAYGAIVGVVVSRLDMVKMLKATGSEPQNVNFAVKSSAVRNFVYSSNQMTELMKGGPVISKVDIAALAQQFTYRVACLK